MGRGARPRPVADVPGGPIKIFSYAGIVMLAVGGACVAGGFAMGPIGRLTLWMIALTLIPMGLIFFKVGRRVAKLGVGTLDFVSAGTGLAGQATVGRR